MHVHRSAHMPPLARVQDSVHGAVARTQARTSTKTQALSVARSAADLRFVSEGNHDIRRVLRIQLEGEGRRNLSVFHQPAHQRMCTCMRHATKAHRRQTEPCRTCVTVLRQGALEGGRTERPKVGRKQLAVEGAC